jgi:ATP-dependent Clp protease ATP-binding subunit ClpC
VIAPSIQIAWSIAEVEAAAAGFPAILPAHFWIACCKVCDLEMADFLAEAKEEIQQRSPEITADFEQVRLVLEAGKAGPTPLRRSLRRSLGVVSTPSQRPLHRHPDLRAGFSAGQHLAAISGSECKPVHILLALLLADDPKFDDALRGIGGDREQLEAALENLIFPDGESPIKQRRPDKEGRESPQHPAAVEQPEQQSSLKRFGRDLCELALEEKLAPVIGRKAEMLRIAQTLLQSRKSNVILVGEPGVGKTGVVEGLAQRIVAGQVPEELQQMRIVELSLSLLVAGTKYRGEFEKRMQAVIHEATADCNLVLFIDEIHTLMGAGKAGGSMDAANILKPALARGDIRVIGATTTAEYRQHIEKDAALERRFQKIDIEEPTPEEALKILGGLRFRIEEHHGIQITEDALRAAVEWSVRYLPDFRLPDKAIDLLDTACAQIRFLTFSGGSTPNCVDRDCIAAAVANRCKIPVGLLTADENARLLTMEDALSQRVKGQPDAIKAVADAVRLARSGLGNPNRPSGAFLFVGPSGTGKTELAKALAEFLFHNESHLIRFDMSEFMEEHSVSKLIGAPPGYKGCEEEGQLIAKVRSQPYSVVLFDEIEKAHPRVLDLFLQVLDEGTLTSSNGRKASFRHTLVIFTSNLGTRIVAPEKEMGFGAKEASAAGLAERQRKQILDAIKGHLRPEFINRLSAIIHFHPLQKEHLVQIVEKCLQGANSRLRDRKIVLSLSPKIIEWIVCEGSSPEYGARELERTMDKLIFLPLADVILEGKVQPGQHLLGKLVDGRLLFAKVT